MRDGLDVLSQMRRDFLCLIERRARLQVKAGGALSSAVLRLARYGLQRLVLALDAGPEGVQIKPPLRRHALLLIDQEIRECIQNHHEGMRQYQGVNSSLTRIIRALEILDEDPPPI